MSRKSCRFCEEPLRTAFVDLGMSPLCQSQVEPEDLDKGEEFFPLRVYLCDKCLLAQIQAYVGPERIFSEYAYFSSFADTLLRHSEAYVDMASARFGLGADSRVVEVASNDGYLLQYFLKRGVPVLGVEPAANVARAAEAKGIPTVVRFFGVETARILAGDGMRADLLLGNNVLPHVPDLHDFVGGLKILLKEKGAITMEFQHVMRMMAGNQFDTIYQEHFSYLSFAFVEKLFAHHGLAIFDVEEIPNHGGSLRIYARHAADAGASPAAAHRVRGHRGRDPRRGNARQGSASRPKRPGTLSRFRRTGEGDQKEDPVVPDRSQARGQVHRRLRRGGQDQYAAQLLRHRAGLHRLYRGPKPP